MATVFALILIPAIIAAIGMVFSTSGTFAAVFALMAFLVLAGGIFVGLLRLSRQWEDEAA